ncbi:nucleoredoxin-like [Argopecten irradians]|uniref:nucleoredoxin-like n=1 Tax=Argopecten irradians TaxID=31199 RepID=UPI00371D3E71
MEVNHPSSSKDAYHVALPVVTRVSDIPFMAVNYPSSLKDAYHVALPVVIRFFKTLSIPFMEVNHPSSSKDAYHVALPVVTRVSDIPFMAVNYPSSLKDAYHVALPVVIRNALFRKFNVENTPELVILDAKSGQLIASDGRRKVDIDPEGDLFPWPPLSYKDIFNGDGVPSKDKKTFVKGNFIDKLEGKIVGIFFSKLNGPYQTTFTSQLKTKYEELRKFGKQFEIVFVSNDCTETSYNDYRAEMPWLALPFKDPRGESFANKFNITRLPSLVLIDENWEFVTKYGTHVITEATIQEFPYLRMDVYPMNYFFEDVLHSSKCLAYFTDSEEDVMKSTQIMSGLAKDDKEFKFFVGEKSKCSFPFWDILSESVLGGLETSQRRQLRGNQEYVMSQKRCLVMSNLPKRLLYKTDDEWTMSEDNVREFITKVKDSKIKSIYFGVIRFECYL